MTDLEIFPFEAPVPGDGDGVPGGLEVDEEPGVPGRHVVHLHHVRPGHKLLQFSHTQPE